jgi:hypothetical protein
MLDHVSITVTNIGAAEKFYDAVMSALGVPKVRKFEIHVPDVGRKVANRPRTIKRDRSSLASIILLGQASITRARKPRVSDPICTMVFKREVTAVDRVKLDLRHPRGGFMLAPGKSGSLTPVAIIT